MLLLDHGFAEARLSELFLSFLHLVQDNSSRANLRPNISRDEFSGSSDLSVSAKRNIRSSSSVIWAATSDWRKPSFSSFETFSRPRWCRPVFHLSLAPRAWGSSAAASAGASAAWRLAARPAGGEPTAIDHGAEATPAPGPARTKISSFRIRLMVPSLYHGSYVGTGILPRRIRKSPRTRLTSSNSVSVFFFWVVEPLFSTRLPLDDLADLVYHVDKAFPLCHAFEDSAFAPPLAGCSAAARSARRPHRRPADPAGRRAIPEPGMQLAQRSDDAVAKSCRALECPAR